MFLAALLFLGCHKNVVYDENLKIPKEGWPVALPAYFDVNIEDSTSFYSMYLNIQNNDNYPNSNIYFFITVVFPDGGMARDTVNFLLADQYGKWLGKGMGNEKTNQFLYRREMLFPFGGTYRFYIEQAMRADTLKGITSIGIKLEKELQNQ
jgi:gliding motility-associated lipoprotein GldH